MRWRKCTLNCAEKLPPSGAANCVPISISVAEIIYDFLQPFTGKKLSVTSSKFSKENLRSATEELTETALALALKLRRSTATYQLEVIPAGKKYFSHRELDFIPVDMDGRKDELEGSQAGTTVFGAFVKYPDADNPKERLVLEKAHVICRA